MNCKWIVLSAALLAGGFLSAEEPVAYEDDYTRLDLEKPCGRMGNAVVRQETEENGGFRYLEFKEGSRVSVLNPYGFYVNGCPALHIRTKVRFKEFKMKALKGESQVVQTISFGLRGGDSACTLTMSPFGVVLTYNTQESVTPEAKAKREEAIKEGKLKRGVSFASKETYNFKKQLTFATWYDIDLVIADTTLTVTVKDGGKVVQKYEKTELVPGSGGAGISVVDKIALGPILVTIPEK